MIEDAVEMALQYRGKPAEPRNTAAERATSPRRPEPQGGDGRSILPQALEVVLAHVHDEERAIGAEQVAQALAKAFVRLLHRTRAVRRLLNPCPAHARMVACRRRWSRPRVQEVQEVQEVLRVPLALALLQAVVAAVQPLRAMW